MGAIDIGPGATDRGSYSDLNFTNVDKANPANDIGIITSVEIWLESTGADVEVAAFYTVDTNNLSTRDSETIGSVTSGSKQTFSGLDMDVATGDYIGIHGSSGNLEADFTGGDGIWYWEADYIPCTNQGFMVYADAAISLYGTGETTGAIYVGSPAINRTDTQMSFTSILKENPANNTGAIASVEIWCFQPLVDCEVATFFVVSGNNLSTRDTETLGTIASGSKQTSSGLNMSVTVGDYLGIYHNGANGAIERTISGFAGLWYHNEDKIPCTNQEFSVVPDYTLSLYGTGATPPLYNPATRSANMGAKLIAGRFI